MYVYVDNNPLNLTDPSGHMPCEEAKECKPYIPPKKPDTNDTQNSENQITWKMPIVMKFGGGTAQEKYMTTKLSALNKKAENKAKIYLKNAKDQKVVLPKEYDTLEEVKRALEWNQVKIKKVWTVAEDIKNKYGVIADPRLMLAIIIQEGTLSFNTNSQVRAADGQHGIQPDFYKDLKGAMNNHVLGKILAYGYYGKKFSDAAINGGVGNGDIFQYINYNVLRINTSDNKGIKTGPYAGHSGWHINVRNIFEKLSYIGAARDYSKYVYSNPSNLQFTVPEYGFKITNDGQDYAGNSDQSHIIIGYPIKNKKK